MLALLKKELYHFFSSSIGYVFITSFLLITGLFLWVLHSDFNIIDAGFASLTGFFELAPWVFLLLIPAACMHSFAEEKKQGTLELLLTKPISISKLILGKYLGVCCIILLALLPTLIYVVAIHQLAFPEGTIDFGSIIGSYIALLFLGASYAAMGIFASSLTQNQTIALLAAVLLCFLGYFGMNSLNGLGLTDSLDFWGMAYHYDRISEGVLDTRDMIYFCIVISIFLGSTYLILRKKSSTPSYKKIIVPLLILVAIGTIGNYTYKRFDLTSDHRFSLSEATKDILIAVNKPIYIDVLLDGKLPPEFKKLQRETKQLLATFTAENRNIQFSFTDPLEIEEYREQSLEELQRLGLTPAEVSTNYEGILKKEVVIPWAMASLKQQSIKIPLLKNSIGATTAERITASVQNLEYAFADAIKQLATPKTKKIAVLKGNGQLGDVYIADYIKGLQKYYRIAPFTLDSVKQQPNKTLTDLMDYDLVINAKPTVAFTDAQKLILDQYLLHGGNQLLLIDQGAAEVDSLFTSSTNKTLAWIRDLKLNDMLFSYGVRVNPQLINDYYSDPIILATGEGNNTQYTPYNWGYSPIAINNTNHPITHNIDPVKFNFSSPIDTLRNSIKKTILLKTSSFTRLLGLPTELNLAAITKKQPKEIFVNGAKNIAVLLEGNFKSNYKNRVLPFESDQFMETGKPAKLLIISDGDVIKNSVSQQQPLELGFDPITKKQYGNKEFLLNSVNYMLNDDGLVSLRTKQVNIPMLNLEKISNKKSFWQWANLLLPLLLISMGYAFFFLFRKRKYTT